MISKFLSDLDKNCIQFNYSVYICLHKPIKFIKMNITTPNLQAFNLPPHLGGNPVEIKLVNGMIKEIVFYDDEYNPLIVATENFHLLNINTLVYIKSKVYAIN